MILFLENAIDEEVFSHLTESDISQLIPSVGLRRKFMLFFEKQYSSKIRDDVQSPNQSTSSSDVLDLDRFDIIFDENQVLASSSQQVIDNDTTEPLTNTDKENHYEEVPLRPYYINRNISTENSVKKLLDSRDEGVLIKAGYLNKSLPRSQLCNLIIRNELRKGETKK